jgi:uridine kinase
VAGRLHNQIFGLQDFPHYSSGGDSVSPIFSHTPEGNRIYKRSIVLLLAAAVESCKCGPLQVEETIGDSMLFQLPSNTIDDDLAKKLTKAMCDLITKDISIEKRDILRSDALVYFADKCATRTVELIRDTPETHIPCHYVALDDSVFMAVAHGPCVPQTGKIDKSHFQIDIVQEPVPHFRLFHATQDTAGADFQLRRNSEPRLVEAYAMQKLWASQLNMHTVTHINDAIAANRVTSLIQLSEASHDHQIINIASQIGGRPGKPLEEGQRKRLVLIAGPSSSGKTTFAKRLGVSLEAVGAKPIVISVDSYYKAWQEIDSRGMQHVDWEALGALNLDLLNEHLVALLNGEEVLVPEYDMVTSMPKEESHWVKTRLPEGGLIIMEGIHCLNPSLTPRVPKSDKFQIMISPLAAVALDDLNIVSSSQVRMLRRMVRDYLFRGRSAAGTLRQWPSVARGERVNIYPNQNNADVVMNSSLMYEAHVLKVHAEPLLRSITPEDHEFAEAKRLLGLLNRLVSMPSHVVPPQSLLREFIGGSWFYDFAGWYKNA